MLSASLVLVVPLISVKQQQAEAYNFKLKESTQVYKSTPQYPKTSRLPKWSSLLVKEGKTKSCKSESELATSHEFMERVDEQ